MNPDTGDIMLKTEVCTQSQASRQAYEVLLNSFVRSHHRRRASWEDCG